MSKQFGIFGIAVVLLGGAVFMFRSGMPVGNVATTAETKNIWAGACYVADANDSAVTVCSQNCGFASTRPRVVYASGNSAAGLPCRSEPYCTYGGIGGAECSQ